MLSDTPNASAIIIVQVSCRSLTQPQVEKGSHIGGMLEAFQQGYQMQQVIVGRIANPALNGDGVVFVENVANGTVVENHHLAKVWLNSAKIFDVRSVAVCTVLAVVAGGEVFALEFKPIDDWIGVLLDRCCKDNEVVPFADLDSEVSFDL